MAASYEDIHGWLKRAQSAGSAYLIVVCDTFDHDDYPVFVQPGEDFWEKHDSHNVDMQQVMEVYDLSRPIEAQLAERRAYHPPARSEEKTSA